VRVHPAAEPIAILLVAAAIAIPIARSHAAWLVAADVLSTVMGPCGLTVLVAAGTGWVALICLVLAVLPPLPASTVNPTVLHRADRVSAAQTPCSTVRTVNTVRVPSTVISTVPARSQHGREHGPTDPN
jgi:hypothetical protein